MVLRALGWAPSASLDLTITNIFWAAAAALAKAMTKKVHLVVMVAAS